MQAEQEEMVPVVNWVKPVLRWAGSKRYLLPEIMRKVAGIKYKIYIEPFAGSASLFFALHPQTAFLSDINEELIFFYDILSQHPRQVHKTAMHYSINGGGYYKVRELNPMDLDEVERAARFLYLNHTCFNGLYRTNRFGQFNVPEGKKTGALPSEAHLYKASLALRKTKIYSGDFEKMGEFAKPGCFYYLDPPYDYAGRRNRGDYGLAQFTVADLPRLGGMLEHINSMGATFLLSYLDTPEIRFISRRWHTSCVPVRRQIAGFSRFRGMISEVLVDNTT